MLQAGPLGYFGESAVSIVLEQVAARLLAGGEALQTPAIYQENVQPAILLIIVKGQAEAGGFGKLFVLPFPAINGLDGEA